MTIGRDITEAPMRISAAALEFYFTEPSITAAKAIA
jgi:hypothetical protein